MLTLITNAGYYVTITYFMKFEKFTDLLDKLKTDSKFREKMQEISDLNIEVEDDKLYIAFINQDGKLFDMEYETHEVVNCTMDLADKLVDTAELIPENIKTKIKEIKKNYKGTNKATKKLLDNIG